MIAVAVSGGMDSLHALHTLHASGQEVLALHGRFLPCAGAVNPADAVADAAFAGADPALAGLAAFCAQRGIPFHCMDATAIFEERIIRPFCEAYAAGHTPNPCALCNPYIKFGALWDTATALGADTLATGHYVRMQPHPALRGTPLEHCALPRTAADRSKDQSYFLALTPVERLRASIFPLSERGKAEIAAELAQLGIAVPIPGESQDVCFVPGNDYRAFLESRAIRLPGSGPVVDTSGKRLGTHQGLWNHTEGQRRGLGIAAAHPLYVVAKDIAANTLIVGAKDEALCEELSASRLNCMLPVDLWKETGPALFPHLEAGFAVESGMDFGLNGTMESGLNGTVESGMDAPREVIAQNASQNAGQNVAQDASQNAAHGEYFVRVRYRQAAQPATVRIEGDSMHIRFAVPQSLPAPGQVAAVYDRHGFLLAGGIIDPPQRG